MKMKQQRKTTVVTKSNSPKVALTKVKAGRRKLPVINATEIVIEEPVSPVSAIHCDHVTITVENITPAKATKLLEANNINRKMQQATVDQYVEDMVNGKWTHCTTPIAIYDNNNIADGQHRLWAIAMSGKSQKFVVQRGLRQIEGLNIDTGRTRTVVDAAKISGVDTTLTNNVVSASRSIEEGRANHGRSSNSHKLAVVNKHREVAKWVVSHIHGRGIANGAVMAAVGRAWYNIEDKNKLARFCEVLSKGMANGIHESAAVAIRNYLLTSNADLASSALWVDTCYRVQAAIKRFMENKPLTICRAVKEETYSL
jgi:hypothetical protein